MREVRMRETPAAVLESFVRAYGEEETVRRLRDYTQLENLIRGDTVCAEEGSLADRFTREWSPNPVEEPVPSSQGGWRPSAPGRRSR